MSRRPTLPLSARSVCVATGKPRQQGFYCTKINPPRMMLQICEGNLVLTDYSDVFETQANGTRLEIKFQRLRITRVPAIVGVGEVQVSTRYRNSDVQCTAPRPSRPTQPHCIDHLSPESPRDS